jgi:murein L,D-transpeptidase YcbB/YkuD
LLKDDKEWNLEKVNDVINRAKEETIMLKSPVAVHILYWTAWAEEDETIHFRNDIYERDKAVAHSLKSHADTIN